MKKALLYGLTLALTLSLTACTGPQEEPQEDTGTPPATTEPADAGTPEGETDPGKEPEGSPEQAAPEEEPAPEPVETEPEEPAAPTYSFTEVNETVYATSTVNIRAGFGTEADKVGALSRGQSITRTGVGSGDADGWSRVAFDGQTAYISSSYLSTDKPAAQPSQPSGGSQVGQPSDGQTFNNGSNDTQGQPPAGQGLEGLLEADNGGDPEVFKDLPTRENAGINVH